MENNIFKTLSKINVNDMVEKKPTKQTGGTTLTYLSWASAFQVAKENYPDLEYQIERNPETGMPYWYDPLTGYMVFTKVTIANKTNEMWLPVMDSTNHAMKAEPYEVQTKYKKFKVPAATMCDINKAIMRCLVKNLSMFGLGLYIYRGEDLPECESQAQNTAQAQQAQYANKSIEKAVAQAPAQQKAPVKDTRPVTVQMVDFIRKTSEEHQVPTDFICQKYRVSKLNDLKVHQAKHIGKNIDRLKQMFDKERKEHLANVVQNVQSADIKKTQPPKQETEGEEITLDLSNAEMEALAECAKVFS